MYVIYVSKHVSYIYIHPCLLETHTGTSRTKQYLVQPPSALNNVVVGRSAATHGAARESDSNTAEVKNIRLTGTDGKALT